MMILFFEKRTQKIEDEKAKLSPLLFFVNSYYDTYNAMNRNSNSNPNPNSFIRSRDTPWLFLDMSHDNLFEIYSLVVLVHLYKQVKTYPFQLKLQNLNNIKVK